MSAELRRIASGIDGSHKPSQVRVMRDIRRVLATIGQGGQKPKLVVQYYLSWENSAGDGMTVNDPEYDELSAWTEELNNALSASDLNADFEFDQERILVYVNSQQEADDARKTVDAELLKAQSSPSPVVKHNANESKFMRVEPF